MDVSSMSYHSFLRMLCNDIKIICKKLLNSFILYYNEEKKSKGSSLVISVEYLQIDPSNKGPPIVGIIYNI